MSDQSSEMSSRDRRNLSQDSILSEEDSQLNENINNEKVSADPVLYNETPSSKRRKQPKPKRINNIAQAPSVVQQIKYLQNRTENIIPRLPFARLVREILMRFCPAGFRIQTQALFALQESSEMYLTQLMEDAYRCTLHRHRVTMTPIDVQLVRLLRGISDPGN